MLKNEENPFLKINKINFPTKIMVDNYDIFQILEICHTFYLTMLFSKLMHLFDGVYVI